MQYALASAGPWRLLMTRPDTNAYGNAILNMAWSFLLARALHARLYVDPLRPGSLEALTGLECDGVRRVRRSVVRSAMMRSVWRLAAAVGGPRRVVGTLNEFGHGGRGSDQDRAYFGLDFRRLLAASGVPVRLPEPLAGDVTRAAAALGLTEDARLVTLHVREAGHAALRGVDDREKDTARNARVETYFDAIDWLVAKGYRVVRVGDPSMTPVRRAGVIDLATLPQRSLALEVWCVLRSAFLMASDSGPFNLSVLTGVPCLGLNITHLIGAYPLRRHDRSLLKPVVDRSTGRPVPLAEMLTPGHLKHRWAPGRFRFDDNTPEEIVEAVAEMALLVEGPDTEPAPAQVSAQAMMRAFLDGDYGRRKQKGGSFYLGDGYFSAGCAARALAAGQP